MSILTQADISPHAVVIDDSSGTDVKIFVEQLQKIYPDVEYHDGPRSGNPVDNWNAGLDRARGSYCILVHHDDFLLDKGYLRRAVDGLRDRHAGVLVGGHSLAGLPVKSRFALAARLARLLRFAPWSLYAMNWIGPTAAVVFQTTRAPRFDRRLCWLADVDFYYRLLSQGRELIRDGATCVVSQRHDEQITQRVDSRLLHLRELAMLREETPDLLEPWQFNAAIACAAVRVPVWLWRGEASPRG
jgi:glycosyltransferase involved in cell wall biosynthesis